MIINTMIINTLLKKEIANGHIYFGKANTFREKKKFTMENAVKMFKIMIKHKQDKKLYKLYVQKFCRLHQPTSALHNISGLEEECLSYAKCME